MIFTSYLKENRELFTEKGVQHAADVFLLWNEYFYAETEKIAEKDVELTLDQELWRAMIKCIYHFLGELEQPLSYIEIISLKFSFLEVDSLIDANSEVLQDLALNLTQHFGGTKHSRFT